MSPGAGGGAESIALARHPRYGRGAAMSSSNLPSVALPLELKPALREAVVAAARGAWAAVEARGYMRVDLRLNDAGAPFVLDVNPNPELGPGVGICRAVQEVGWSWERFVRQQIEWA